MTQELETKPEEVKPPNLEEMSEQMRSLQDANRQVCQCDVSPVKFGCGNLLPGLLLN